MTVSGQAPVTYGYDAADRLTQIVRGNAIVGMSYDGAGRRTALSLPNGIVTTYAYDAASRLTGLTYTRGATVLGSLTYAYDAAGNRVQVGGTWARTALPPSMTSATYDAANRQLSFGGQTLTYDPNGNLASDGVNTYTWNPRNQLVGINGAGVTASFAYDAVGRRRSRIVDGTTVQFRYDGLNPVQETGTAGTATLLTGLGIDEYLTRTDTAGTRTFLADALGSTVALTDAAGVAQEQYTYEPFGATTAAGTIDANTFQYTGRENDPTGLYYYRARYYHPRFGRFIGEDPTGFRGGPNLYTYAMNSPLRWIDPLGLDVTISLWSCCFRFNHTGIGVNTSGTVGFYPVTFEQPFDEGVIVFDAIRQAPWDFMDLITLRTTSDQDQKIQAYIDQRWANPGRYNILSGRHCGGFVQEALRAGGIDPFPDVASPGGFFKALKALWGAGRDFRGGVPRQEY
jgi:RHS repeat-associated protein